MLRDAAASVAEAARFSAKALFASLRHYGIGGTLTRGVKIWRRDGLPGLERAFNQIGIRQTAQGPLRQKRLAEYRTWIEKYDTLTDIDRDQIRTAIAALARKPIISVIMPVYDPAPRYLDAAVRSVRQQLYPEWELCIADDCSSNPKIRRILEMHAAAEPRIKLNYRTANGHISQCTNSALALARGELIAFLDHDDILPEHCLFRVALELDAHPEADIIYSDSDSIDHNGGRSDPFFKSDFNLELMLGENFVNHLTAYRRNLVESIGGMRAGFEGSQDYDLFLRALAKTSADRVRHIPTALYHWRHAQDAPSYSARHLAACIENAHKAVTEFLVANAIAAEVTSAPDAPQWQRIKYRMPDPPPSVSVIVPTKNQAGLLARCVEGLRGKTDYAPIEIVIVDHDSDEEDAKRLIDGLRQTERVVVLDYTGPFNFSAINNFAVERTAGEILVFLNNDTEILHRDWLTELVSIAARPGIGAVGAKLYYPDGSLQHAGVITGMGGVAGHLYLGQPGHTAGLYGEALLTRQVSAVTAACMAVSRQAFIAVGGFDEVNLPVAFNDVDFCLRLAAKDYRNIFTPFASLRHHESATRGPDDVGRNRARFLKEYSYMLEQWGDVLPRDPFFNPNRSLDFMPTFADPPRYPCPWNSQRW